MITTFREAIVEVQCPMCRSLHHATSGTNYSTFAEPCDACVADPLDADTNSNTDQADKNGIEDKVPLRRFGTNRRKRKVEFRSLVTCNFVMMLIILVTGLCFAFQPVWKRNADIVTQECDHGNWNNTTRSCDCNFGYQRSRNVSFTHKCDYASKFKSTAIYLQMNPLTGLTGFAMWYLQRDVLAVIQFSVLALTILLHLSHNEATNVVAGGYIAVIINWIVSSICVFSRPCVDGNGYALA